MTVAIGSREPTNVGAATYPTVFVASTDRRFIKKKETSYYALKLLLSLRQFWWQRKHKNPSAIWKRTSILATDVNPFSLTVFTTLYSRMEVHPSTNFSLKIHTKTFLSQTPLIKF